MEYNKTRHVEDNKQHFIMVDSLSKGASLSECFLQVPNKGRGLGASLD